MYKCKYLELPGNYFKVNNDKNQSDGIYKCGALRAELGIYPYRCDNCRQYSPSNIIMPEISISSYHRIFHEPEKYAMSLESNKSLGKYHPWRSGMNPKFDSFSKQILDIKNQKPDAIEYFTNRLHDILNENEEYVICVIPSSKKGLADSGIRAVAKRLCQLPIIDGTNVIIRNRTMNPNHLSAKKRSLEEELDSLTIDNEGIIRYKQVLLLDDITTRGISFKAARLKLKDAGAFLVAAIALGQTQF